MRLANAVARGQGPCDKSAVVSLRQRSVECGTLPPPPSFRAVLGPLTLLRVVAAVAPPQASLTLGIAVDMFKHYMALCDEARFASAGRSQVCT